MGYDTVSFEGGICPILPHGGALTNQCPGYIDSREKLDSYPFDEIKDIYIKKYKKYFDALRRQLPEGMKCIGGSGYGIFEISQDLVGYENLAIMSFDEPEMFADLFSKIGDMFYSIWKWVIDNYSDIFCVFRFGDDLGFRSNTLLSPDVIREYIMPNIKEL